MDYSYRLLPVLKNPKVDPGGELITDFYYAGFGIPKKNKLNLRPSVDLLKENNPGNIQVVLAERANIGYLDPKIENHNINSGGFIFQISNEIFQENPNKTDGEGFSPITFEGDFEIDNESVPPLRAKLNISEDASAGDHKIYSVLTYGNQDNVFQDSKEIDFHVTSWYERNRKLIEIIGIISALVVFLGSIGSLIP